MTASERKALKLIVSDARREHVSKTRRGIVCLTCDVDLGDVRANRLYCSKRCANQGWAEHKRAKNLCRHGHLIEGENAYRNSRGFLNCRECRLVTQARYRAKRRRLRAETRTRRETPAIPSGPRRAPVAGKSSPAVVPSPSGHHRTPQRKVAA